jgi:hypothetical protein
MTVARTALTMQAAAAVATTADLSLPTRRRIEAYDALPVAKHLCGTRRIAGGGGPGGRVVPP